MISPRLSKVVSGTRLTTDLINSMIKRTEYAADLLQQYKLIAGNQMYIESHYDGTRVSYLQPVAGGATPTQPIFNDGSNPDDPATINDLLKLYGDTDSSGTQFINLNSHDENFGIYINPAGYNPADFPSGLVFRNGNPFSMQFRLPLGFGIPAYGAFAAYELIITADSYPELMAGIAFNLEQAIAIQTWAE